MQRFIISLILLLAPLVMRAQLFKPLEVGRSPFVRLSVDPTVPLKTFLQKADMTGFEATVDSEIMQNLFLIGGLGNTSTHMSDERFSYANTGAYAFVGADLNLTQYANPQDRDIFFVGLRYGFSVMSHEAEDIVMENYWGSYSTDVASEAFSASWLELAAGVKTEWAKNFFVGWTAEAKFRTHLSDGEMTPYNIPGFGKTDASFTFDLNIFLSYAITLKPKKAAPLTEE